VEAIRKRGLDGETYILFMMDGREALIVGTKYSKEWWKSATEAGMAFCGRFTCKECNKSLDTYAEHVRAWLVS